MNTVRGAKTEHITGTVVSKYALVVAVAVMVACSWLAPFDEKANEQVDSGLKRAVATYATARLLNAAISVLQGTEVSLAPIGVGMTLTPGQALDPVNDLVEQFSKLMLVATVAFGVQKVLLVVGASWMISLTLTVVATLWGFLYLRGLTVPRLLARLLLILLMARFALPVSVIGTEAIFQRFLLPEYQVSHDTLKATQSEAGKLGKLPHEAMEKQGLWEKMSNSFTNAAAGSVERLESLKLAAEQATDRIISLMVIFTLQTIVFPILLIWVLFSVGRGSFEMPAIAKRDLVFGRTESDGTANGGENGQAAEN